jgi:hypothetical protein
MKLVNENEANENEKNETYLAGQYWALGIGEIGVYLLYFLDLG